MKSELNDAQQAAAAHLTGPALTLSGPGSDKTTVLIRRTMNIAVKTGHPERILSVTFTNAAGREMLQRYQNASEQYSDETLYDGAAPVFKTVHSFCNGILREYETLASVRYERIEGTESQKKNILRRIYCDINGEAPNDSVLDQIASGANGGRKIEIKNMRNIIAKYQRYKEEHQFIDFDDMIMMASDIMTSDSAIKKEIRERNQHKYDFIQVDEAQDLTKMQFDILRILANHRNIFVVADDDQSIYGFRDACPECIRDFYHSYPDCKMYQLVRNYRSVQSIVNLSDRLISQNTERFQKNLYSENERGTLPKVKSFKNGILQAEYIIEEFERVKLRDKECRTAGVLYRNNISGLLVSAVLTKRHIPFVKQGDIPKTYKLLFVEQILREILQGERAAKFWIPPPKRIFNQLLEDGIERNFEDYCRKARQQMRYKDAALTFLTYLCGVCNSAAEIAGLMDAIDTNQSNTAEICLSTVHSAKGLEYDAVFVIDMVQGEFPGSGCTPGKMLEEERRLFYVALTRAKKYLYVTYPLFQGNLYRKKEAARESIFIEELKKYL